MAADISSQVVGFVEDVLDAMGLDLTVQVTDEPEMLRIDLEGEDGELLLRRRGEGLDALQHIVNTVFRRQLPADRHIGLDCLGYRKAKDAELREMARFLAAKAKETGEAQEIGPLNPYARRIVHLAVAEDPTMTSESIGDAFMKSVLISPRRG